MRQTDNPGPYHIAQNPKYHEKNDMTSLPIGAVILAGGKSRRFRSDKASARFAGNSLLERTVNLVRPLATEIVVVGPWAPEGVLQVREDEAPAGPLAALTCGLTHLHTTWAFGLACDYPLLRPSLLSYLSSLVPAQHSTLSAIVPRTVESAQPLLALYHRKTTHTHALTLLQKGKRSLHALLNTLEIRWALPHDWQPYDLEGVSFLDADTPEELAQLKTPENQQYL